MSATTTMEKLKMTVEQLKPPTDRVPTMTKGERDDLCKLVRQRAKLMKAATAQRCAELRADFEAQIASIYSWDDDEVWSRAAEEAEKAVAVARDLIDQRCAALRIPKEFRPTMITMNLSRGQNASAERRAELRMVAKTRIAAIEKAAHTEIERYSVETQTKLIAAGLTSEAAQQFLVDMPIIEVLMPTVDAGEIKRLAGQEEAIARDEGRARHRRIYGNY